jgi:adenylate cyclase
MSDASSSAFNLISNEMKNAEVKSYAVGELIQLGILDPSDQTKLSAYTTHIMQHETKLYPSVQSIYWGDETGSFIMAGKQDNDSIRSLIINHRVTPPTQTIIERDPQENIIHQYNSTEINYDPRLSHWYTTAKQNKIATWLGIYQSGVTGLLETSIATPVYKNDGTLIGVINFNLRLDYMRKLVESIRLSEHSVIFLVTNDGKLIAFPTISQYHNKTLMDIHDLPIDRWAIQSFEQYKTTHQKAFSYHYDHADYLASFAPLSRFGSQEWLIGAVVPMNDFIGQVRKTHLTTLLLCVGILLIGILIVVNLVRRVVKPLKKITAEIKKIKNFELEGNKKIRSRIKEVTYMADALYSMKKGLRTFQKYVPASLVRQLIESGEDVRVGGVKKPLVILFTDIQNFTTISEQEEPDQLTRHICEYFDELSKIITASNGTIDKYIGDAIMAFWGAPLPVETPCHKAAEAALRCIQRSTELNMQWQQSGKPVLYTRIGVHLGEAIVGNLGSSERLNYTAIGDPINIASRLEGINKIYGTQIIVSDSVYRQIKDQFILRRIDYVTLKGKATAHFIYELVAEKRDEIAYDYENYTAFFTKGFDAYQQQKWAEAIQFFTECLKIYNIDTLAPVFIQRCNEFSVNPPVGNWNGAWSLTEK